MGVHGLKSYIESDSNNLKDLPFRESRLVIDGCNLYHSLFFYFQLDQIHGGDYDAFEDGVRQFFTNLKACDIHPYVVLDGGADHTDKKFETLKAQNQSRIRRVYGLSLERRGTCTPLLLKNVFRQTLQKLKVPFVQCLEEADWEIAALAKQWNCPVLSNDSDFYVFDLPAGLLPTGCFRWKNIRKNRLNKKYIPTKHFTVEGLCASFNDMNKKLLPLFACILGNDYVNLRDVAHLRWEVHSVRGGDFARIDGLLCWLSKFPKPKVAIDEILKLITHDKDDVREILLKGIKEYKLKKGSLDQFFHSKTLAACTGPLGALPTWTVRHIHEGKMGSVVVDVLVLKRVMFNPQVEDFKRRSSSETSRPIRQVIYGLILLGEQQTEDKHVLAAKASTGTDKCYVTEFDREGLILTSSTVEAIGTKVKEGLQLETLWKEPHTLRLQVFLEAFGVPFVTFRGIPPHLQLQVFVTRFWLVNAQPQPNLLHLWGLLLGMVEGRFSSTPNKQTVTQLRLKCRGRMSLDHEVAHLYSQWQSCLKWGLCLNRLLCLPLPEPECAQLYRGTLVHQVVRELKRGITPESMLVRGSKAEHLFRQLSDAVLSLVDEDVMKTLGAGGTHKSVGKTQSDKRSKNQSADELSSCFEHQMCGDTEDCDDDDDDDDEVNGKERKAKDHKADTTESSYSIRTRHKAKARNTSHPSKKFERRCFE